MVTIAQTDRAGNPLAAQARDLRARGFVVLGVAAGSKRPVGAWRAYQGGERADEALAETLAALEAGRADRLGLVCGVGGLVCLDIDAAEGQRSTLAARRALLEALGLPEDYPWAGASQSGRGSHLWLIVPDLLTEVSKVTRTPREAGAFDHLEVRARLHYVALPRQGDRCGYGRPLEGLPASVPWAALQAALDAVCAPIGAPEEDEGEGEEEPETARPAPAPPRTAGNGHAGRAAAWAEAALADEVAAVRAAVKGTRNDTLNRAAYSLGQIVAAGHLAEAEVADALAAAARDAGLPAAEARATIRSGLRAGGAEPRHPPERPAPAGGRRNGAPHGEAAGGGEAGEEPIAESPYRAAFRKVGYSFRYNEVLGVVECNGERLTDMRAAQIRCALRARGVKGQAAIDDEILDAAAGHAYHPIRDYLERLQWDGADHIAALAGHMTGDDPDINYTDGTRRTVIHAYLRRWLIGAVRRVYTGQHHPMLVLVGAQGVGKSELARWLAGPLTAYHREGPIDPHNRDHRLGIAQTWIWEVSELDAVTRRADIAALKGVISAERITERAAYARHTVDYPALASFVGTVNDAGGFLADATGYRRFLCLAVSRIDWAYTRNVSVDQVWAQAVALYRAGEPVVLSPEEREMQHEINRGYESDTPILSWVASVCEYTGEAQDKVTIAAVIDALADKHLPHHPSTRNEIARALHRLGATPGRTGREGRFYRGVRLRPTPAPAGGGDTGDTVVTRNARSVSPRFMASGSHKAHHGDTGDTEYSNIGSFYEGREDGAHAARQKLSQESWPVSVSPVSPPPAGAHQEAVNRGDTGDTRRVTPVSPVSPRVTPVTPTPAGPPPPPPTPQVASSGARAAEATRRTAELDARRAQAVEEALSILARRLPPGWQAERCTPTGAPSAIGLALRLIDPANTPTLPRHSVSGHDLAAALLADAGGSADDAPLPPPPPPSPPPAGEGTPGARHLDAAARAVAARIAVERLNAPGVLPPGWRAERCTELGAPAARWGTHAHLIHASKRGTPPRTDPDPDALITALLADIQED